MITQQSHIPFPVVAAVRTDGGLPDMGDLRYRLRAATRGLHRELDQLRLLARLLAPTVSLTDYLQALLAMHAVMEPVEIRVGEYVKSGLLPIDAETYRRTPDLVQDLAHFGVSAPEPVWDGPPVTSIGALVGCLYVQEGSARGGPVIFRKVGRSLGLSTRLGGRFLSGGGHSREGPWRDFWHFADTSCPTKEYSAACDAAAELSRSYVTLFGRWESCTR